MYTALLLVIAKNWKQPPCPSIDEQKNKPWYNRTLFILFSSRKKWAIQLQKRHKENVNVYQVKSEIWKNYLLYNSNYMIIRKSQDYRDSKKVSGCQVFGRGWGVEHRGVLGTVELLYDTIMVDIWHYAFGKTPRTGQRISPNANYEIHLIMY